MRVEFVKEIHDGVGLEGRAADHDVFFALSPVRRVGAAQLLPFHPRERELLELRKRGAYNLNFVSEKPRRRVAVSIERTTVAAPAAPRRLRAWARIIRRRGYHFGITKSVCVFFLRMYITFFFNKNNFLDMNE